MSNFGFSNQLSYNPSRGVKNDIGLAGSTLQKRVALGNKSLVSTSSREAAAERNSWREYFGEPARRPENDVGMYTPRTHYDLPEAYRGSNSFLDQLIIGQITKNKTYMITEVSPVIVMEDAMDVSWDIWKFDDTTLDIVPEESVGRLTTSTFDHKSESMLRYGKAIVLERGFAGTQRGRISYAMQLKQVANATVETFCHSVGDTLYHGAMNRFPGAPNSDDGISDEGMLDSLLQEFCAQFGILNKSKDGFYTVIEKMDEQLINSSEGRPANLVIMPQGSAKVMRSRPELQWAVYTGRERAPQLDPGSEPKSLKRVLRIEKQIYMSCAFLNGHNVVKEDVAVQTRTIGCFNQMAFQQIRGVAPEDWKTSMMDTLIHSMPSDDYALIRYADQVMHQTGLFKLDPETGDYDLTSPLGVSYFGDTNHWGDYLRNVGMLDNYAKKLSNMLEKKDPGLVDFANRFIAGSDEDLKASNSLGKRAQLGFDDVQRGHTGDGFAGAPFIDKVKLDRLLHAFEPEVVPEDEKEPDVEDVESKEEDDKHAAPAVTAEDANRVKSTHDWLESIPTFASMMDEDKRYFVFLATMSDFAGVFPPPVFEKRDNVSRHMAFVLREYLTRSKQGMKVNTFVNDHMSSAAVTSASMTAIAYNAMTKDTKLADVATTNGVDISVLSVPPLLATADFAATFPPMLPLLSNVGLLRFNGSKPAGAGALIFEYQKTSGADTNLALVSPFGVKFPDKSDSAIAFLNRVASRYAVACNSLGTFFKRSPAEQSAAAGLQADLERVLRELDILFSAGVLTLACHIASYLLWSRVAPDIRKIVQNCIGSVAVLFHPEDAKDAKDAKPGSLDLSSATPWLCERELILKAEARLLTQNGSRLAAPYAFAQCIVDTVLVSMLSSKANLAGVAGLKFKSSVRNAMDVNDLKTATIVTAGFAGSQSVMDMLDFFASVADQDTEKTYALLLDERSLNKPWTKGSKRVPLPDTNIQQNLYIGKKYYQQAVQALGRLKTSVIAGEPSFSTHLHSQLFAAEKARRVTVALDAAKNAKRPLSSAERKDAMSEFGELSSRFKANMQKRIPRLYSVYGPALKAIISKHVLHPMLTSRGDDKNVDKNDMSWHFFVHLMVLIEDMCEKASDVANYNDSLAILRDSDELGRVNAETDRLASVALAEVYYANIAQFQSQIRANVQFNPLMENREISDASFLEKARALELDVSVRKTTEILLSVSKRIDSEFFTLLRTGLGADVRTVKGDHAGANNSRQELLAANIKPQLLDDKGLVSADHVIAKLKARFKSPESWKELLLAMPINSGDFPNWCLRNDFLPMFNICIARPAMTFRMGTACALYGGGRTMRTAIGHHDTTIGHDSMRKMINIAVTIYGKAILTNPEFVAHFQDVLFKGYHSGAGHAFWDPLSAEDITALLHGELKRKSAFAIPMPVNEFIETWRIDLANQMNPDLVNLEVDPFFSTLQIWADHWHWRHYPKSDPMNRAYNATRAGFNPRSNTLCFKSHQLVFRSTGGSNGQLDAPIRDMSPLGPNVYPGCGQVWKGNDGAITSGGTIQRVSIGVD